MTDLPAGYNPLLWDCEESGCFNVKKRPKIEVFADCFPGKISFGDVDALAEYHGYFCLLEWKEDGSVLKRAQIKAFAAFTELEGPNGKRNIVVAVNGDAETMAVSGYSRFWKGERNRAQGGDLDDVKRLIRSWVAFVKAGKDAGEWEYA